MKRFLLLICALAGLNLSEASTRSKVSFSQEWRFEKGDVPGASSTNFDDSAWKAVCLPHTWNNLDGQDGGDDYYRGPAWYRKTFMMKSDYTGKRVFIRFGAAGFIADVYVNGKFVGEHRGGFAAFVFDITNYLRPGEKNLIAVRVDNTSPRTSGKFQIPPLSADFTMDGGLYRKVYFVITDPVHISLTDYGSPGVFITQKSVTDSAADIQIATIVKNDSKSNSSVILETRILDGAGKTVRTLARDIKVKSDDSAAVYQETAIRNPHLWNGRPDPYMYTVVVSVYHNRQLLDQMKQPLGLRYYKVDLERGFFLNGRPYKLHGVCLHEDMKGKGRAITDRDRSQEMEDILDIGATVVRFAHYQYGQEMYRLCDKYGIVVWTEIPLVNEIVDSKTFEENAKQQLKELILQDYNHPCVSFWGIFNEIHNVRGPDPLRLVEELNELAKKEDPTRLTTAASDDEDSTNFVTDVLGMNKYFGWYYGDVKDLGKYLDKWHSEHPDRAIGISEYGAGASIYQHDELPPEQSNAGSHRHTEEYQTFVHEMSWKKIESRPYIWFSTLWNMFDFASDSRNEGFQPGINDKGIITQDHSTKKDAYYWYKVNWTNASSDKNQEPLVHITSKMFTVRDTSKITIDVYSNAPVLELFVNEMSLGKQTSGDHKFFWRNVNLSRGENHIKAVAVIGGKEYFDECWWKREK